MRCTNCKEELKVGAKFCTKCGTKTAQPEMPQLEKSEAGAKCPKCGVALRENSKFCTKCGYKLVAQTMPKAEEETTEAAAATTSSDQVTAKSSGSVDIIKQNIIWNVAPGEIARRVKESEFIQYDSASGIIVNDGTTAIIKANGALVAELKGGRYEFIDPKKLEEILESRVGGLVGGIKSGFKSFFNAIVGSKVKDKVALESLDPKTKKSLDEIIKCMKQNELMSLTLKLDKSFELLIGAPLNGVEEYQEFQPMVIKTKYLDVNISIRGSFNINNFEEFARHYLSDRDCVSTYHLAEVLTPLISSAVERVMFDVELDDQQIPEYIYNRLCGDISNLIREQAHGITIENISNISVADKDLDRLRAVSRELYLSDKELSLLVRTNDMKNRLNAQLDEQELYDLKRDYDKEARFNDVNRDGLLSREEFAKFKEQLELEREIRQAQNKENLSKAKEQIELEHKIRNARNAEELAAIEHELEIKGFKRIHAFNLDKRRAELEVVRLDIERDKAELERMREARIGKEKINIEEQALGEDHAFENRKREDEYTHQSKRRDENYEIEKAEKIAQMQNRAADTAMDRLQRLKEMERQEQEAQHAMELEKNKQLSDQEMERLNLNSQHSLASQELDNAALREKKDLSPEQLMAIAAAGDMSSEAAQRFAESFSNNKDAKMQEAQLEDMRRMSRERVEENSQMSMMYKESMENMMKDMMQTARSIAGGTSEREREMKNEYKDRLHRQEDRLDNTQDKALDYTTKNNIAGVAAPKAPQSAPAAAEPRVYYYVDLEGKDSVKHSLAQLELFVKKGIVGASTLIYSSTTAEWVEAYRVGELSHLFAPVSSPKSVRSCPNCGVVVSDDANFCGECQYKL